MTQTEMTRIFNNIKRAKPLTPDKAFGGREDRKANALALAAAHREADSLAQGVYYDDDDTSYPVQACLVGCLSHSSGGNPHLQLESLYGIPEKVAVLADDLFEAMPDRDAFEALPEKFLNAIPIGADLRLVPLKFYLWVCDQVQATPLEPREEEFVLAFRKVVERSLAKGAEHDAEGVNKLEWENLIDIAPYYYGDLVKQYGGYTARFIEDLVLHGALDLDEAQDKFLELLRSAA
jgi:hypothetical protein